MDANATLRLILESLESKDRQHAIDSLRDLADHIDNEGYLPSLDCWRAGITTSGDHGTWRLGCVNPDRIPEKALARIMREVN